MSIKFICSCGKHLRARDEMAARRSMCPRCGAPVGIPSMRPTHRGTAAAPMTPQERQRHSRDRHAESAVPTESSTAVTTALLPSPPPAPAKKRRTRHQRHIENHWYECLTYPFLNMTLLHATALILTAMTAAVVLSSAELARLVEMGARDWLYLSPGLLMPLLILAYVCGTIECALKSALAGQGPGLYWPGWGAAEALKSGLRWLGSLLAGPLFLASLAGYYWLYGGDLSGLDWCLIGELAVFAAAYWLLLVVSLNERHSFLAANPVSVARLIHRLRYRAVVPLLVVPALLFAHLALGFFAVVQLHDSFALGILLLGGCWWSGVFCALFVFRLLGVWCYRTGASGGGP
jgi:hypothetical protein